MSHTADLFVRYLLTSDGNTLVEEVGVVTQHTPQDVSLTEIPSFKFANWCNPPGPSFVLESRGVHDVQIWRTREYELRSNTFEEMTYHPSLNGWERVIREVRSVPDNYANRRLLESLFALNKNQLSQHLNTKVKKPRGGDTRAEEVKQLWADADILKRFARLVEKVLPSWRWIKTNVDSSYLLSSDRQQKWVSEMWQRTEIKSFAAKHPKLTEDVLRRAVDDKLTRIFREPRLLAYYHAALELEVNINGDTLSIIDTYLKYEGKPPAPCTLKTPYDKGKILLDQSEQPK
jgi:hypothetical protein